jgi:hypothetical protein
MGGVHGAGGAGLFEWGLWIWDVRRLLGSAPIHNIEVMSAETDIGMVSSMKDIHLRTAEQLGAVIRY